MMDDDTVDRNSEQVCEYCGASESERGTFCPYSNTEQHHFDKKWTKEEFAEAARRGDNAPFLEFAMAKAKERSVPCEACDTDGVVKGHPCAACDGFGWRKP